MVVWVTAPTRRAIRRPTWLRPMPTTESASPRWRRAMPIDPPIRPTPTIATFFRCFIARSGGSAAPHKLRIVSAVECRGQGREKGRKQAGMRGVVVSHNLVSAGRSVPRGARIIEPKAACRYPA